MGKPFCLMRNTNSEKICIENAISRYLVKNTPYDFFAKLYRSLLHETALLSVAEYSHFFCNSIISNSFQQ